MKDLKSEVPSKSILEMKKMIESHVITVEGNSSKKGSKSTSQLVRDRGNVKSS